MLKNKNKAFTLVELIVVITILAILGTIAFISLQGYSKSARDAKRVSDISNIKTSLALFSTRVGRYPEPDNITDIVYSGATVWSQGVVGDQVTTNLKELGKTPLDPLLETEYVYSLLNTKKEYEVGCIFEGDLLSNNNELLKETYAATNSFTAYVKGDYNGKIAKVSTGSTLYLFAVPSIIGAVLTSPDIDSLVKNKLLVFNGHQNIPANYSSNNITMTGGFDFGGASVNPLIYSGSIQDLSTNYLALESFGTNLQNAYSGTILSSNPDYSPIIEMNVSDSDSLQQVAGVIVQDKLGGEIAPAIKCATNPGYANATFVTGTVVVDNTSRQNSNAGNPCYYVCTGGYSGIDCSTGPTGTFTLASTSIDNGTNTTISDDCTISPTSYTSSNTSVATISGTTITSTGTGTTNISQVGGACGDITPITLTVVKPFVASCDNTEVILYADAVNNKAKIIADINNYISCNINDYPGDHGVIGGLTNSNTDILILSLTYNGGFQWKTSDTTTAGTTSTTDGRANTQAMVTAGISNHPAGEVCVNIGTDWYLPAKDEAYTFYINRVKLSHIIGGVRAYSSTQAATTTGWAQAFFTTGSPQFGSTKTTPRTVFCTSSF